MKNGTMRMGSLSFNGISIEAPAGSRKRSTAIPQRSRAAAVEKARAGGRKAALRGVSVWSCSYADPELAAAWEAGWRETKCPTKHGGKRA